MPLGVKPFEFKMSFIGVDNTKIKAFAIDMGI